MRNPPHIDQERHFILPQLEQRSVFDGPRQQLVADERPCLGVAILLVVGDDGAGLEVALQEGLRREVVGDAARQVLQDALHGVARLLTRDAEELLESARHRGEDGLSCLGGVHGDGRTYGREKDNGDR